MKLIVAHKRLNGARVSLIVEVDADGAIMFWRSEDPTTGEHVVLSTPNKWYAASAMHTAIARMRRGAA